MEIIYLFFVYKIFSQCLFLFCVEVNLDIQICVRLVIRRNMIEKGFCLPIFKKLELD